MGHCKERSHEAIHGRLDDPKSNNFEGRGSVTFLDPDRLLNLNFPRIDGLKPAAKPGKGSQETQII